MSAPPGTPGPATARPPGVGPESPDFGAALLSWYAREARDLPWRRTRDPYAVWVSEVMLQQTQVARVMSFYVRWMERFPDVATLAGAEEDDVFKAWEGLGYYSRARNLHAAAKILAREHGGRLPTDFETLRSLPGIGPYTAASVSAIAHNLPRAVVDANVERVFARVLDLDAPVKAPASARRIREAASCIPGGRAREFSQGLMELGALVCTPKDPACPRCPVASFCRAFEWGSVALRPVSGPRRSSTALTVAVGVLRSATGRVLIQKRPPGGLMGGLWEFPGGKVEPGETPEAATAREFMEELGLAVEVRERIATIRHAYTTFRVTLHAFFCDAAGHGDARLSGAGARARWVAPAELSRYPFPAANARLVALLNELAGPLPGGPERSSEGCVP